MSNFRPSTNMSVYETNTPISPFRTEAQFGAIGAPPGTSMSPQLLELLKDVPEMLNLAKVGVSTPWAAPRGDLDWTEIQNPDTNVSTFLLKDADIRRAQDLLFGQALPFVVIKTLKPVSRAALEGALRSSPYELFETQAVYRQDDPNPIPRIEFHHWLKRIEGGTRSMDAVADQIGGDLLFGQQVPVEGTTVRAKPIIPFKTAFNAQFLLDPVVPGLPTLPELPGSPGFPGQPQPTPELPDFPGSGPIAPEPEEPVSTPSKSATTPFWGPVLVAGAFAAAVVVLARSSKK